MPPARAATLSVHVLYFLLLLLNVLMLGLCIRGLFGTDLLVVWVARGHPPALYETSWWNGSGLLYFRKCEQAGQRSLYIAENRIPKRVSIRHLDDEPLNRITDREPELLRLLGVTYGVKANYWWIQWSWWTLQIPAAGTLVLAHLARRRMLRRRAHHATGRCVNCGYDLRATPERCPECGDIASNP
jgi:hypothetical protein